MKLFQRLTKALSKSKLTQIRSRLNGKEINLTSEGINISSNNFKVDENGNMVCNDATLNNVTITGNNVYYKPDNSSYQSFVICKPSDTSIYTSIDWYSMRLGKNGSGQIMLASDGGNNSYIEVSYGSNSTQMTPTGILTPKVTQTSKESKKKNISEYNEKALDIVRASTIYEFNFKSENDKDKKHIGFVIGDKGGEYKTPEQVISNDREGIENYSMTSILWKAVQEQQTIIEQLQNEIKELKGEKKDGED